MIDRRVFFAAAVPLFCLLVQSCGMVSLAQNDSPPPTPVYVIKVDRDKTLKPSAVDDSSLDKYFADEIEQPGISRDRFDRLLADAIVKFDPSQSVVSVKDHTIALKRPKGDVASTYTDNVWAICKDIPGSRKRSLRTFLTSLKEISSVVVKDKGTVSDVIPLVRSALMVAQMDGIKPPDAAKDTKSFALAWYPLAPGIICVYASDSPNSLSMLSADDATKLGLGAKEIKAGPMRTLRAHLPTDISFYGANGIFMVTCGGDFESSLILDDEVMKALKERVKGRLVFGVSNKDILMATGDQDHAAMAKVRQVIEHGAREGARPISDKLYYWDDGKITLCP